MGKRRKRTNWKVQVSPEDLAVIASALLSGAVIKPPADFRLCSSSGIWQTAQGSLTARLVYKGAHSTHVCTFRGLRVVDGLVVAGGAL